MLGRTGVAHYGRRCSWAHSEGHIGVAHYGILVSGPLQLRWQPIGRRCLWAHLGEVPTEITILSLSHFIIYQNYCYFNNIIEEINKFCYCEIKLKTLITFFKKTTFNYLILFLM